MVRKSVWSGKIASFSYPLFYPFIPGFCVSLIIFWSGLRQPG